MNKGGFSWKTFFGLTALRRKFAIKTGIPTTLNGWKTKIGGKVLKLLGITNNKSKKK